MTVENTSKRDPAAHLGGMLIEGTTGYIEGMEADGQRQLVQSAQLPIEGSDDPAIVAMGIEFGEPANGDPLFISAKLPPGWTLKATDHAMWSKVLDEAGKERISVFYKAAYYDRRAFMRPVKETVD